MIEGQLVMGPGAAPVLGSRPGPEVIPQRFVGLNPDKITILFTLDGINDAFKLGARLFLDRGIRIVGGDLRSPLGIGEAEGNPALFRFGNPGRLRLGIDLMGERVGIFRIETLGLFLQSGIALGSLRLCFEGQAG